MNQPWLAFVGALAASYLLTWCARWLAPRFGLVDRPDGKRKLHARPTPLLGGAAIFAAILFVSIFSIAAGGINITTGPVIGVLAGGVCFVALGLWDDRSPLRARTKLSGQVLATIPFLIFCGWIEEVSLFGFTWNMGSLAIPFTIFWLVSCVNIVNLLDGHDGLAGTIGLIGFGSLAALTWMGGSLELAVLCLIIGGAIAGFLIHNWPPAKIFLGDAGSMTIGFLIGALSMSASLKSAATFTLITPLAVLCVPIFDTCMAILRRKLSGRGMGEADRGHIHHCLQDSGFSRLQTLLVISGLCLTTAVAAIVASWLESDSASAVMCVSLLLVVVASGLFGDREMLLVFRHVRAVSSLLPGAGQALSARLMLAKLHEPNDAERQRFAEQLRQRFANAGGTTVRLVAARGGDTVGRHAFAEGAADVDEAPANCSWSFAYRIDREDGHRVALTIAGQSYRGLGGERLEDVIRLLDAVCRNWALDDLYRLVDVLNGRSRSDDIAPRRLRIVREDASTASRAA